MQVSAELEPPRTAEAPEIESDAVLGGRRLIRIRHDGMVYTLRVTRQGKLLLTK